MRAPSPVSGNVYRYIFSSSARCRVQASVTVANGADIPAPTGPSNDADLVRLESAHHVQALQVIRCPLLRRRHIPRHRVAAEFPHSIRLARTSDPVRQLQVHFAEYLGGSNLFRKCG